jgi:hypothetical protein
MRWYLPDGVARPEHLPPLSFSGEVALVAGPDGKVGRIIGGLYCRDEPGWIELPQGWWINPLNSKPGRVLRLDARPGIEIEGADGAVWLVPTIFSLVAGGLVWAGEQRLGPSGWTVPPPPEPWRSAAIAARDVIIAGSWEELGNDGVLDLALPILCSNYHLIPAELRVSGWVVPGMIGRIFPALLGLEA